MKRDPARGATPSRVSDGTDPILAPLNERQREAVTRTDGPLLVLAGPGSGKTRVITHRIAHLVRQGVAPERILGITFTNKAAAEMRDRIETLLGSRAAWISTFHSFAARLLRRHVYRLSPFTTAFTIYDADDSLGLIKECLRSLDYSTEIAPPRSIRAAISRLKNRGIEDPEIIPPSASLKDQIAREVFPRYRKALEERNALDFDDLLLFLVRLLDTQPDMLERYREQFRYVLIDEYQDTNEVQYRIGSLIAAEHRNICVTGDPDQSIYSWRGADLRNILRFESDYADATVVKLEQNYRSTGAILRAANAVIQHNLDRKEKVLWTENPEGDPVRVHCFPDGEREAAEIADLIERYRGEGLPGDRIGVLYRINALSRELEQALILRGIPYAIVGAVEFFQRREIKDVVAYLRLLVNPRDAEALRRIINVPPRGIGKATLQRILETARTSGAPPLDVVLRQDLRPAGNRRMERALAGFAGLYEELKRLPVSPALNLIRRLLDITGYEDLLKTSGPEDAGERIANLQELLNAASQYDRRQPEGNVEGFLEEVSLFSAVDRWQHEQDRVTLMTLHSAKGLEFDVVILAGLEERLLPLLRIDDDGTLDIEEERRLFFVGITRARENLYLTHAESRLRFGSRLPSRPSPFLRDLVEAHRETGLELDAESRIALARCGAEMRESDWDDDGDSRFGVDDWDDEVVDEDPYPPGARVHHETYGEGSVIRSSGRGRRRRLTIDFAGAGEKHIVLGYSRLRRL